MESDIDKANQIVRDGEELARRYMELIMAVGSKFPGETRHETALRYIKERETSGVCSATIEQVNSKFSISVNLKEFADGEKEIEVALLENGEEISKDSAAL